MIEFVVYDADKQLQELPNVHNYVNKRYIIKL